MLSRPLSGATGPRMRHKVPSDPLRRRRANTSRSRQMLEAGHVAALCRQHASWREFGRVRGSDRQVAQAAALRRTNSQLIEDILSGRVVGDEEVEHRGDPVAPGEVSENALVQFWVRHEVFKRSVFEIWHICLDGVGVRSFQDLVPVATTRVSRLNGWSPNRPELGAGDPHSGHRRYPHFLFQVSSCSFTSR